jgi:hypothetical protein
MLLSSPAPATLMMCVLSIQETLLCHTSNSPIQAAGIGIFTSLATMIFVIYWFISTSGGKLYNYWALFATEIFVLIFWLCTFALLASKVAPMTSTNIGNSGSFGSGGSSASDGGVTTTTDGTGGGTACYNGYCTTFKRSIARRSYVDPFSATLYVDLAISVVNL